MFSIYLAEIFFFFFEVYHRICHSPDEGPKFGGMFQNPDGAKKIYPDNQN